MPTDTTLLSQLPPGVAGYVALALIVLWAARRMYRESADDKDAIIERLSERMDKAETDVEELRQTLDKKTEELTRALVSLAEVRAELAAARDAEKRCTERMEAMEARHEKRVAQLQSEIDALRSEISEPLPV